MSEELFEHGIQTENSDIRAHVSVVNRKIYVFETRKALEAAGQLKLAEATAGQNGVNGVTGLGWLMPVGNIPDLRRISPEQWPGWDQFTTKDGMTTSQKGILAVECVLYSMRHGRFPFWVDARDDDRLNIQLKGTDIIVFCRKRIQVKCDWSCGDPPLGTGNLFLQRAERNPLRRH